MSEKLSLDPNSLTIGDLEDFEEIVGLGMDQALSPQTVFMPNGEPERDEKGRPVKEVRLSPKALKALVYIVKRQGDPDFTLADARKTRVTELDLGDQAEDPDAEKNGGSV